MSEIHAESLAKLHENEPVRPEYPGVRVDRRLRNGLAVNGLAASMAKARGRPCGSLGQADARAWGTCTIPQGQQWVGRKAKAMWNQLVDAIMAKKGSVSVSQKFLLHSIIRSEIHCQLAERLRRDRWNAGTLSLEQFDSLSRNIVKISAMRDRMVLELGVDENQLDVFSQAMNDPDEDDPSMMLDVEGRVIEEPEDRDGDITETDV